jgi:hypothetical protein
MTIVEKIGITVFALIVYGLSRWMVAAAIETSEQIQKKREELKLNIGCLPFSPIAIVALVMKYLMPILLALALFQVWTNRIVEF